jgi:predicted dehydrogenase
LIELARHQSVYFTVTENSRFVAAYLKLQAMIKAGELGEPRMIRTFISGSEVRRLSQTDNWKGRRDGTGGGAILDAGAHSIYLLKWLVGEIEQVWGYQYQWVPESQVEDNGMVGGRMKNGALFSTEYSFTIEAPWNERVEYHGSKGSVIIDQLTNPPAMHFRGGTDFEGVPLDVPYEPRLWKVLSIKEGVKDFVNAVRDGRPPAVDPMDACYAVWVLEHAYRAIAGYTPLKL